MSFRLKYCVPVLLASLLCGWFTEKANAQIESTGLELQLKQVDPALLVQEAQKRGDAKRGALAFFMSPAGCVKCHTSDGSASPLGPDLSKLGAQQNENFNLHIVESLLDPSKAIRKGYETVSLQTTDGKIISGILVRETDAEIVLRDISELTKEITIQKADVEERAVSKKSIMPSGLVSTLAGQREFLDIVRYLMEIARGGPQRAAQLKPSPEQLIVRDDTQNLDHKRILKQLGQRDFRAGQRIYEGLCINCHGANGNTPSLPTARAFGKDKLKFGGDPHQMFLTLSRGNGLMAPTTHLSPKERYQVVHYIRERFMSESNPSYETITDAYLDSLPSGTELGERGPGPDRDFGPALASQLRKNVTSALTVKLGKTSISYNLHTMGLAGVWQGGFLDLEQTQHIRGRGEGVPIPKGKEQPGLKAWKWGHDGRLDLVPQQLKPRGPLPDNWMHYNGHYLHNDQLVLSYSIDGREILELPSVQSDNNRESETPIIKRTLRIGPGKGLVLAVAGSPVAQPNLAGITSPGNVRQLTRSGPVAGKFAIVGQGRFGMALNYVHLDDYVVASVSGETDKLNWSVDRQNQLVLTIPADHSTRLIDIVTSSRSGNASLLEFQSAVALLKKQSAVDPSDLTSGGEPNWPEVMTTTGYLGKEQGAYVVDTLTIPEETPWNTWFRTSAVDFFPDGRMVVATHGGDIWIVSGIDDELLELKWKRFAGGMYEPFGVKVVDGHIYVTCKDRLTKLHDLNGDNEADFYESFSADDDVSAFFHAFNFDLHVDDDGNFYYVKAGQYTDYALPGAVIKISPDGKKREVYCTGFRTPNGMGIFPDNRLTVSDNQGNWMPASKINLVKPGGFYGYVQTHSAGEHWAPDGGRIDHRRVIPPKTFDQPILWLPQNVDNSSGGQLYAGDPRWGPLSGHMLHTSFGKGWLFYLMMQDVGDVSQAAIVRMRHDFSTGIMRGRVNPQDGQVYVTGLDGWNGGGRKGLKDKGIERVRYTGKPFHMVTDAKVEPDGLRLTMNFKVNPDSLKNRKNWEIEQWNYQWRPSYGSEQYHPETGAKGHQKLNIDKILISPDGRSIKLVIPNIRPVNQLRMEFAIETEDEMPFEEEIYWTINRVPSE